MNTRANGYIFGANQHFEANGYIWDKWALEACGDWDKWAFGEMVALGKCSLFLKCSASAENTGI